MVMVTAVLLGGIILAALIIKRAGVFERVAEQVGAKEEEPDFTLVFFLKNNEDNLEWVVRRLMLLRFGNYEPFRIVLIDRGSTDRTLVVAACLQRDYPAVELINGVGSLVSVDGFLRSATGRVVAMEDLSGEQDFNYIISKMRILLKKQGGSWDRRPRKIETREEYTLFRQNDTIK